MNAIARRKKRFWLWIATVALLIVALQALLHAYILIGGPYSQAIKNHSKLSPSAERRSYALCFLCPKKIRYGAGFVTYRFTIEVESATSHERIEATVRRKLNSDTYIVDF